MLKNGHAIIASALFFLCVACSGGGSDSYGPSPAPPPPGPAPSWADVAPIVQKDCGGCHGVKPGLPVFDSGAHFKASAAKSELEAGAMPPPPKTISDADKSKLLAYLGS